MGPEDLTDRQREILCEVVRLFLEGGEAVASTSVARRSPTGLSPASIRNVMAELEELGFLHQPHTSAGRVPTDKGLNYFVQRLLQRVSLAPEEQQRLRAMLSSAGPLEELLERVSRVLAQVTLEVGMALAPAPQQAALRSLHFLKVAANRVLAVVVTMGGLVESRLLAVDQDYQPVELERISTFCTETFAGLTLAEIRARLLALTAQERVHWDALLLGAVELGTRVLASEASDRGEVFLRGTEQLLRRAEASQMDTVRRLFEAFADKALLLSVLNEFLTVSDPRVVVGSELSLGGGGDLGLIVTSFQLATGECGLIGVIGLKRMNYPYIIPIVDYIGHYLGGLGGSEAWHGRRETLG